MFVASKYGYVIARLMKAYKDGNPVGRVWQDFGSLHPASDDDGWTEVRLNGKIMGGESVDGANLTICGNIDRQDDVDDNWPGDPHNFEVKEMVARAASPAAIDSVLEEHAGLRADEEKLWYLRGLYCGSWIAGSGVDPHEDYAAVISAIASGEWKY